MTSSNFVLGTAAPAPPQEITTSPTLSVPSVPALPPSTTVATYAPVSSLPEFNTKPSGRESSTSMVSENLARVRTETQCLWGGARKTRRRPRAGATRAEREFTTDEAACMVSENLARV
eukprot:CAMPEP_0119211354 /NCGR_PEP_ID=MMETSP1327-20130426/2894_1 /TAXON_ID=38833 /ORGANISM="Micromonas pusilla, Strain RCC2306" /LENGTH=117 /DNA_ID=CAMNT_0007208479 /DNA_START=380 /DNA_END=729 /DNA_ORIENTATION=-